MIASEHDKAVMTHLENIKKLVRQVQDLTSKDPENFQLIFTWVMRIYMNEAFGIE